jgi:hypothetical protein
VLARTFFPATGTGVAELDARSRVWRRHDGILRLLFLLNPATGRLHEHCFRRDETILGNPRNGKETKGA